MHKKLWATALHAHMCTRTHIRDAHMQSLHAVCVRVLRAHAHCLYDVGWLEPESVREILNACSPQDLRTVEDGTWCVLLAPAPIGSPNNSIASCLPTPPHAHAYREGSQRQLSWYTWHLWYRHFVALYGPARAAAASLLPLPGLQPLDYTAPKGCTAPTGARGHGQGVHGCRHASLFSHDRRCGVVRTQLTGAGPWRPASARRPHVLRPCRRACGACTKKRAR